MTRLSRLVTAVFTAPLFAIVVGFGLVGAAPAAPPVFDVRVDAAPATAAVSVPAAVPLDIDIGVGRSSVAVNSQPNVVSQAAIVYLPLLETAPVLLGIPPLPPEALPYCYSYFPGDPREASCGGPAQNAGPFDVAGGSGHTKTTGESSDPTSLRSESSVVAAQVRNAASLPLPLTIGGLASAARVGADDAGRMAAGASTAVTDLDIAGVLQVRSLRTEVTAAVGGSPGSAVHKESMALSGVTVAGQPVTVDNDGVHAGGQALGRELIDAQRQVDETLAASGLQVRTVPPAAPKIAEDGTGAEVSSGGLVVSFSAQGGQARVELVFGVSHLVMSAYRDAANAAGVEAANAAGVEAAGGLGAGGTSVGAVDGGASAEGATAELPLPPPAPRPGAGSPPPSSAPFRRQLSARAMAAPTWRVPYGPFALLVLAGPLLLQARRLSLTRR